MYLRPSDHWNTPYLGSSSSYLLHYTTSQCRQCLGGRLVDAVVQQSASPQHHVRQHGQKLASDKCFKKLAGFKIEQELTASLCTCSRSPTSWCPVKQRRLSIHGSINIWKNRLGIKKALPELASPVAPWFSKTPVIMVPFGNLAPQQQLLTFVLIPLLSANNLCHFASAGPAYGIRGQQFHYCAKGLQTPFLAFFPPTTSWIRRYIYPATNWPSNTWR